MKTEITELLNIEYPIIQGGMAWVADYHLAAAVSNAGGLGLIGSGGAPASWVKDQIREVKKLTDKPFGVNIMLMNPEADEIAKVIVEEKVPVVTTGAGNPAKYIKEWKEAGVKVIPVVASCALAKMMELGWIPMVKTVEEKVKALLSFFQVSTERAWEDYYLNQQLKVAFRISLNNTKEPHAISAWLRQGEVQAAETEVCEFSEKALREAIPAMKSLCAEHPADFAVALQELCAKVGVKLVYTPCLPKAPINGSTRWINDAPCIQMTGRHKRNDIFWFTFFHELGHILLHGKKDIFLEDIEYADKQKEKEEEADAFSSRTLLSQAEENEIIRQGDFSADTIRYYAEKFNVHPAIIVGRLQHKKVIPFTAHSTLIEKIELFN